MNTNFLNSKKKQLKFKINITLFGYYGYYNLGDDLMLEGLIQVLCNKIWVEKINVIVNKNYYKHIEKQKKVYFYEKSKNIKDRLKKIQLLFNTDIAVWGGGTCLYDSCPNNLRGLNQIYRNISFFSILRKPYVLFCVGIGKVSLNKGRKLIQKILRKSSAVFFRDPNSLDKASEMVKTSDFFISGDPVFLLKNNFIPAKNRNDKILRKLGFCGVYHFKDNSEIVNLYAKILIQLIKDLNLKVYFIPLHRGEKNDNEFHKNISKELPINSYEILEYTTSKDCIQLFKEMDFIIGFRLHSIIVSDLLYIPNIAIEYSPKIKYYILKSKYLSDERLKKIGEFITTKEVKNLFCEYHGDKLLLNKFIEQEKIEVLRGIKQFEKYFIENKIKNL